MKLIRGYRNVIAASMTLIFMPLVANADMSWPIKTIGSGATKTAAMEDCGNALEGYILDDMIATGKIECPRFTSPIPGNWQWSCSQDSNGRWGCTCNAIVTCSQYY